MAQRKTLTEAQIGLLRWIKDGCPDGVMSDDFYRISAAALRSRGLVETSGRGPTWGATITSAGRDYLAALAGKNPPKARQANISVTEQLVADVIAAGGSMSVPRRRWNDPKAVDYERRVQLAHYHGKVPDGMWLSVSRISHEELLIELLDAPDGTARTVRSVPVPMRVARYHPLVAELKNQTERREVSRRLLPRLLRVVNALVVESERRGYLVRLASDRGDRHGRMTWSSREDGHLVITVDGYSGAVRASEDGVQRRATWSDRYWLESDRERASRGLVDESAASGRLCLELVSRPSGTTRVARWADRRSWTVEDKLPELLREIEIRAVEQERERAAAERKAAERYAQWQAALVVARERYEQHVRAEALMQQVAEWRKAGEVRAFCDAVHLAHPDDVDVGTWLEWARRHADALDPVLAAPRPPTVPDDPSPDQLKPFLVGWDPYEPVRRVAIR